MDGPPQGFGAEKPQDKGLTGFFAKKQVPEQSHGVQDLNDKIGSLTARLRIMEERSSNTRRKIQLIEQDILSERKKSVQEFQATIKDMTEIKKEIDLLKSKLVLVIKELKLSAKREDVLVLQKYLNLWEPVHFVTQNEVEKMVARAVEEKLSGGSIVPSLRQSEQAGSAKITR